MQFVKQGRQIVDAMQQYYQEHGRLPYDSISAERAMQKLQPRFKSTGLPSPQVGVNCHCWEIINKPLSSVHWRQVVLTTTPCSGVRMAFTFGNSYVAVRGSAKDASARLGDYLWINGFVVESFESYRKLDELIPKGGSFSSRINGGRLTEITYPEGNIISFEYARSRLRRIIVKRPGQPPLTCVVTTDAMGRILDVKSSYHTSD